MHNTSALRNLDTLSTSVALKLSAQTLTYTVNSAKVDYSLALAVEVSRVQLLLIVPVCK
jgi:hypothetical protein